LGGPIGSRRERYGMRLLRHRRGNPDTELCRSLKRPTGEAVPTEEGGQLVAGGESDRLILL
jgi:hypothetical protein